MILPIVRISELFIEFNFLIRSFIIYYILGFLAVFYSIKFSINPGYTKKGLVLIPLVIIVGVILGIISNMFELNKYAELIFLIPIIAFSEELLFRGLIQNIINKEYGFIASIFFSSLLYCIFSLYSFPLLFIVIAFSLISGIIYHFTKNIYLSIILNLVFHLFILII
jgi:membrane protease YdiL (CAAX protease family)